MRELQIRSTPATDSLFAAASRISFFLRCDPGVNSSVFSPSDPRKHCFCSNAYGRSPLFACGLLPHFVHGVADSDGMHSIAGGAGLSSYLLGFSLGWKGGEREEGGRRSGGVKGGGRGGSRSMGSFHTSNENLVLPKNDDKYPQKICSVQPTSQMNTG